MTKLEFTPKQNGPIKPGLNDAQIVAITQDGDKHWKIKALLVAIGREIEKRYPTKIKEGDATHQDLAKLIGREIPNPGNFDIETLKGAKFVAVIGNKKTGTGNGAPHLAAILTHAELAAAAEAIKK